MPASARPAYWRSLTTFDRQSGTAVLSFATFGGEVLRLQLNLHDLEAVHDVVGELLAQRPGTKLHSERSSGSPSLLGSPQDGQNVCPPATSSAACCAVAYDPRSSSSKQGCHLPSRLWRMVKSPLRVLKAQSAIVAKFSIGDRTHDGEAPRRYPQGCGGAAARAAA